MFHAFTSKERAESGAGLWIAMLKEFQLAQSRAREESEQRYPTEWAPPDQVKKRIEFQDQIMEKYEGDLAEQFGLTPEQLGAIVVEGLQKDWPYPE